jgi:large subunit ribosomal protein L21
MYAIIEVGAKQYTVQKDDIIEVEKQPVTEGKEIALDRVLLVAKEKDIEIGQPYLKGVKVKAIALGNIKAEKLISYKYRRRKSSHSKIGHRQLLTRLKIKDIELS